MRVQPHLPLLAASAAALLVLAAALGLRGDGATLEGGGDVAVAGTAIPDRSAPRRDAEAATPGRDAEALALGKELLIPAGDRVMAPQFAVQTASFGNGAMFAAPVPDAPATIVFFMAAWCFTCQPEARALARIHERYASEGVVVLTLDVDRNEGERELAAFREHTGRGAHLWAFDRGLAVARALEVGRLDATVVIDRDGRIAYEDASPTDEEYLSAIVEALLAERRA